MSRTCRRALPAAVLTSFACLCALGPATAADQAPPISETADAWPTLGLMRVRDMTPFGISRLDMLPAHTVVATPGTSGIEVNYSYQNTWALSDNVKHYLESRGIQRGKIGPSDIAAILGLPTDAYLVDGEFGLTDLTLHYLATKRAGFYLTVPYFTFGGGFLDATIEGFHDTVGISNADRNYAPRNQFLAIAHLKNSTTVVVQPPASAFGDPVVGVRYSLNPAGRPYNIVLEGAAKMAVFHGDDLVTTGANDYGVQISLQRFFRRNALYATFAEVYYQTPDPGLSKDLWIPTLILGWEGRISRHLNFVLQAHASKSTVQETELRELSAAKIQVTGGVQWLSNGYVLRFGITENVAHYDNTPDIGVNLSLARILFRGPRGDRPAN